MTTTTQRDFLSPGPAPSLNGNSPGVSARARARVPVTDGESKKKSVRSFRPAALVEKWWVWTAQPATIADTWAASAIDRRRISANNSVLYALWRLSNATDRLIMFALIVTLPSLLTGLLRWCATRPTRRYSLYLTVSSLLLLLAL